MSLNVCCFHESCEDTFGSIDGLRDHSFFKHPGISYFKCKFGNTCSRTFEKWDSYSKHLNRKHSVPRRYNESISVDLSNPNAFAKNETVSSTTNDTHTDFELEWNNDFDMDVENDSDNTDDFYALLLRQADILVAKVYNKPGLPRSMVDFVVEDVTSFLTGGPLQKLKIITVNALEAAKIDDSTVSEIKDMFESLSSPFAHLSTEYLRQKHFQLSGAFIPPIKYTIESRPENGVNAGSVGPKMKKVTGQFLHLRHTLKQFFELPDALSATLAYMDHINSEKYFKSYLIPGSKWKCIKQMYKPEDIVLPLTVYYDDWEPNNALGPHCEKIGCVYVSVASLPPECQSKNQNRFEALMFNADDRKLYGNEKTFRPLIDELKYLESEGVIFENLPGKPKVYFATVLLRADNLGLHGMCGLVESFSGNFPCHTCKASKALTETMVREDRSLLRDADNYAEDLNLNDPSLTGIKEEIVFKEIKTLYCMGIGGVFGGDGMHDGHEGVAHYTMIPIINHFYTRDPFFLEVLNGRMYMFDFGKSDGRNQPPSITPDRLKSKKLQMTASEMICFVKFFGLLVGDYVDPDDPYWHLYLLLHDIVSILLAKELPNDIIFTLQYLIEEHHSLYMKLTKQRLKPKHHYLLHYGLYFEMFGPFDILSCMRDESLHKLMKAYTTACMSRRDVLKSLAIKRSLAHCLRFIVKESVLPKIIVGRGETVNLSESPHFFNIKNQLPASLQNDPECFCTKWVDLKGTLYHVGMVLILGVDESRLLRFGEIVFIIPEETDALFICSSIFNLGLNSHIRAYEVKKPQFAMKLQCVRTKDLIDPFPLSIHTIANGEKYIVPKFYF